MRSKYLYKVGYSRHLGVEFAHLGGAVTRDFTNVTAVSPPTQELTNADNSSNS